MFSFSLKYYFVDTCNMLFLVPAYPWEHKKYTKLLKRVFLLCMVNLLSHTKENEFIESTSAPSTSIVKFMSELATYVPFNKKSEYVQSINGELYYYHLLHIITQFNQDVTKGSDDTAKLHLTQFNDDINQILHMSSGLISASFLQSKTNTIIDDTQTRITI